MKRAPHCPKTKPGRFIVLHCCRAPNHDGPCNFVTPYVREYKPRRYERQQGERK